MFDSLDNKSLMRNQEQDFDQVLLLNSYNPEEGEFSQNVKTISQSSVPKSSNIIDRHTINKLN